MFFHKSSFYGDSIYAKFFLEKALFISSGYLFSVLSKYSFMLFRRISALPLTVKFWLFAFALNVWNKCGEARSVKSYLISSPILLSKLMLLENQISKVSCQCKLRLLMKRRSKLESHGVYLLFETTFRSLEIGPVISWSLERETIWQLLYAFAFFHACFFGRIRYIWINALRQCPCDKDQIDPKKNRFTIKTHASLHDSVERDI
jgi:hypothetical protein